VQFFQDEVGYRLDFLPAVDPTDAGITSEPSLLSTREAPGSLTSQVHGVLEGGVPAQMIQELLVPQRLPRRA
jgi:hypothetical protein